jgi:hypothetical protein
MLTDDIKAITQLIDVIASKLGGPEHARRLAILRGQLLTLLREAAQAEEAALSVASSVPVTRQMPAENHRPRAELQIMDDYHLLR